MADITKIATMDFEATALHRCMIYKDPDLVAGEAITKGQPCYIKPADGKTYKAVSTVLAGGSSDVTNLTAFHGFAYDTYAVGDKVSLVGPGGKMFYTAAAGLTPGALYYVSDTAGNVSDTALVSHDAPIAFAVSDQSLVIIEHAGGNLS